MNFTLWSSGSSKQDPGALRFPPGFVAGRPKGKGGRFIGTGPGSVERPKRKGGKCARTLYKKNSGKFQVLFRIISDWLANVSEPGMRG